MQDFRALLLGEFGSTHHGKICTDQRFVYASGRSLFELLWAAG
jgi:hypothetical protein